MLKNVATLATAALAMAAFAQEPQTTTTMPAERPMMDTMVHGVDLSRPVSELSYSDQWRAVNKHAMEYLLAGDQYRFERFTRRAPSNYEVILVKALANVLQQSVAMQNGMLSDLNAGGVKVKDFIVMNNGLGEDTAMILGDGTMTANQPTDGRAMRFARFSGYPNLDLSYDKAVELLIANLNDTEKSNLNQWFWMAEDRDKDVIIKFIKSAVAVHALNARSALRTF